MTATTLGLAAATASNRSIWLWGSFMWERSNPSLSLISSKPTYSRTMSAFFASSTALACMAGSPLPERG